MKAMDAFFADAVIVPEEEKQYYAEEVRYLPCALGAFFPRPFPAVNQLPALTTKRITFGSFNRLAKVSDEAFRLWSKILLSVPDSRMILKTGELDDPGTRDLVIGQFTRSGITADRITLLGRTNWQDHMSAFNSIDLCLDPFPHGGGVTTLEGLMMGVPVVTLRWPTLVGRVSASILTTLGLTDWIAETNNNYVSLAVEKSKDLSALVWLREQLRERLTSSVIGDANAYAKAVESEYISLWHKWCCGKNLHLCEHRDTLKQRFLPEA